MKWWLLHIGQIIEIHDPFKKSMKETIIVFCIRSISNNMVCSSFLCAIMCLESKFNWKLRLGNAKPWFGVTRSILENGNIYYL